MIQYDALHILLYPPLTRESYDVGRISSSDNMAIKQVTLLLVACL